MALTVTGSICRILKSKKTISLAKISLAKQFNLICLSCCDKYHQYISILQSICRKTPVQPEFFLELMIVSEIYFHHFNFSEKEIPKKFIFMIKKDLNFCK